MEAVNSVLRPLVAGLLYPFRGLHPLVGLTVVSLVVGIAMLLVFKATSNQGGIAAVKRKIHACLFEIRLFNDDLRAILRAQGELLRHNLVYLKYSFVPLLWMIVPLVLLMAQLQFHYGYEPLAPGESALVEVVLGKGWEGALPPDAVEEFDSFGQPVTRPVVALAAPPGVRVETPGVWAPELREVSWRVAGERPGDYELEVTVGGETYGKSLRVAEEREVRRLSPIRPRRDFLRQLLDPAEPPLPAGPVESIDISYDEANISILGWKVPAFLDVPSWMWVFFILSIVFAFALRNRFGVSI